MYDEQLSINYFDKLYDLTQIGSGSIVDDTPNTVFPNIQQFITSEINRQLLPVIETQNALISHTAEMTLKMDSFGNEVKNISETYFENYQLKKKIKNINTIHSFYDFKENWNNNNASPFSENVLNHALQFINLSTLKFQPNVFPTGRDSIQFEYEKSNGAYLEIEIFENHYQVYLESSSDSQEIENITIDDILGIINDFHSRF